jgi:hypothetical protein
MSSSGCNIDVVKLKQTKILSAVSLQPYVETIYLANT